MSIKLKDFDSKLNDISPFSTKDEASRSLSVYKQRKQTRILYLISFLITMSHEASILLSTFVLTPNLDKADDKSAMNSFSDLALYNILASTCASVVLGFISDRVGRKVVLNICLIGSALSMALYGFCKSLNSLYFINALNGFFSCTPILIKMMIGEANDRTSRPNAFRYLPIIGIVARVLGPMITTSFAILFPIGIDFDKGTTSIDGSPYLIPSLITSGISASAYILSYYCLSETLTSNVSKSEESVIVDKPTDQTMTLTKSKKINIFRLNLSKNSLLLLILSSLLSLIYNVYYKISQEWLTMDLSKGEFNLKTDYVLLVAPLSPIIMVTILLKYPYIVKNFGVLKQFKAGFPVAGVLLILSIITTLIVKSGSTFIILSLYAILCSANSGINTLKDISFDLLLTESAEVSGNLGTLYGISIILSGISNIFSTAIKMVPYPFKQLSAFSTENGLPFPLNCVTSWFLVVLSLIGYWLSSKIETTD